MKNLIILILVLFAINANAQTSTLTAFSASAYAKATTSEDTSATLSVGAYPHIVLHTTSTGSDSSVIYANIDAYINGVWANNVIRDTLSLGRPVGYTLASTKGQVKYRVLRNPTTDIIASATSIRIRNKHASGAGDSTSALTYTQKVIMRKP
jgi:hypothetical protein